MKKIMFALLLTAVFAAPAFSQKTGMGMDGMRQMDRMEEMMGICINQADKIGLTEDQMGKIKPMHSEMQKKHAQFKADLKIADVELMEVMDVKDFDIEKANSAVKKISDIKTAYSSEMLKSMKEMRGILTDEQFKKMKSMKPMNTNVKKPSKKKASAPKPERTILDTLK